MKEKLDLRISAGDAALLDDPDEALLLGLIMSDGEVRLKGADPGEAPGHIEWMTRDQIPPRPGSRRVQSHRQAGPNHSSVQIISTQRGFRWLVESRSGESDLETGSGG